MEPDASDEPTDQPDASGDAGPMNAPMEVALDLPSCGEPLLPEVGSNVVMTPSVVHSGSRVDRAAMHAHGAVFVDVLDRVLSLPLDAAEASVIWERPAAEGARTVAGLAADAQAVYLSTSGPLPPLSEPGTIAYPGILERIALSDGERVPLIEDAMEVHRELSVDDEHLYYVPEGPGLGSSLFRMPKAGGAPEAKRSVLGWRDVASAGDYFYFFDRNGLHRWHRVSEDTERLLPDSEIFENAYTLRASEGHVLVVVEQPDAPEGAIDQAFLHIDLEANCHRLLILPQKGVVGPQLIGTEVFWKGFSHNTVSSGEEGPDTLWLTDLATNTSHRIEVAGVDVALSDVLGRDASHAYLLEGDTVLRVTE
jgi:hypothetical protein